MDVTPGFENLPQGIPTLFLDTCVWSNLIESAQTRDKFISVFEANNLLAALSMFTVFELSRATRLFQNLDDLFSLMRFNVWIPILYDELFQLEIANYPRGATLLWMPISSITDNKDPSVMSKLANDERITRKRDEFLSFGNTSFMKLEELKANFPPDENGKYTVDQAEFFAWANTVDFLGRQFMDFLTRFRDDASSLDTKKLASVHMRGLFLFFKYYIHGQSPVQSDFMDFAHVSYVPYMDFYITERNVLNVLRHIRSSGFDISNAEYLHVNEFIKEFE